MHSGAVQSECNNTHTHTHGWDAAACRSARTSRPHKMADVKQNARIISVTFLLLSLSLCYFFGELHLPLNEVHILHLQGETKSKSKLFMLSTFMKFIWLFCCRAVKSAVRGKLYRVSENKTRLRSTSHSTCGAIYMSSTSTIVIIQRYRFQKCAPNCIALRVAPSISQKI